MQTHTQAEITHYKSHMLEWTNTHDREGSARVLKLFLMFWSPGLNFASWAYGVHTPSLIAAVLESWLLTTSKQPASLRGENDVAPSTHPQLGSQ